MLVLLFGSSYAWSEDKPTQATSPTVQHSGKSTLSAASDAAAAAALAAKAAADAASTAAQAASAAIQAINSLLPPNQRADQTPSPQASTPTNGSIFNSNESPSAGNEAPPINISTISATPTERSLLGLLGSYEVPVEIDQKGEFIRGLSRIRGNSTAPSQLSAISLDEALSLSLGFSRDVLIAQYRQEQAKAQSGQARAVLLPSLTVSTKTGDETSSPSLKTDPVTGLNLDKDKHHRSDKTFTVTQPLLAFSDFYTWRRYKLMEQAKTQNSLGSKGDAYLATINAYLNVASSKIQADMTADYEAQIMELYRYLEKRVKAGAANPSDLERVKARVINIHSSKVEQDSAHAAAGIEFIRLVNVVPSSMKLPLPEELGAQDIPSSFEVAAEGALDNNPDIQALREELAAAEMDITSAKGKYLPKLNLEASKNEVAHAGGSSGVQKDDRLMLVLNWTPFNGGGDQKLYEEKLARRNELIYRVDDQRRRVLQNLSAQYATLDAIRQRLQQGYDELESVSSAAKSMSARMLSGNQSLLDLLDVYERNYQAKTRLVTLHIQEMTSVAQIARLFETDPSKKRMEANNQAPQ